MDTLSIFIISTVMAIFVAAVVFIALNPPAESESTETFDTPGGIETFGETGPDNSGF